MIDYVKLEINSKSVAEEIRKNELLEFSTGVLNATGEETRQIAKYKGMKIFVYPNDKIFIEGSIHKFFNSGEHNHNDFNFKNLSDSITELYKTLQFKPNEAYLRGFEFGININTIKDPSEIIEMIVCSGKDYINQMNITGGKGITCKHTNHITKIYNKSLQYKLDSNILRIENKTIRMRKVKGLDIVNLHDLTNPKKINSLLPHLIEMFEALIIHEPITKDKLTKAETKIYEYGNNPRFWTGLNNSQRYKKRKQYECLISNRSVFKIKETLTKQIANKWNYLLKKGDKYTGIEIDPKGDKCTRSIVCISDLKTNEYNDLKERRCLSCGRDISKQRKGSKYCSEKMFGKDVKQCRNNVSNPKNNFRKRVKKSIEKYSISSVPLFSIDTVYKYPN